MVFDVGNILNASQRSQLLASQTTARALDVASLRLASGLRVNSALDSPQNFFTARAVNYRAGDLNRLLDGIGQNIQVIKAADNGVTAALRILDQAEAYVTDVERRFMNGEISLTEEIDTSPPDNVTNITFDNIADLQSYAGAQDGAGVVSLIGGNTGFSLDGNLWKRRLVNYTITADTVLEFDFRSSVRPEVSGIGFDNDTNFGNDNTRFFLYGDQTTGVNYAAPTATFQYDGSGDWVHVEIPVGQYFTGTFSHIHFINDDDGPGDDGDSFYNNMFLREGPIPPPDTSLNAPDEIEQGYAQILNQLDLVVADSGYRGVNLLDDKDMTTVFNESRTSKLVSEGIAASSAGLGLGREDFTSLDAIREKLDHIRTARETLRGYAGTLANDLAIITTRLDFSQDMINTLRTGADMLTLADQNEEGAKLLALETRQQIQYSVLATRQASILEII
ncbi:MAG: hypothetical protein KKA05_04415 [Alphaproteobacteria bacterium]|nr:hypothetical protein [Alphaproteobacteria bacterium]MBU0859102.1 hypothetical protein [Alphaproteobacteria bacterium]